MVTVGDLAKVMRSKNAGAFMITVDVFFDDRRSFEMVAQEGFISRELVAELYGITTEEVLGVYRHESALGIKVTMLKRILADDPANTDVQATQQHLPLSWLQVPDD
jgi:hypothetical protein